MHLIKHFSFWFSCFFLSVFLSACGSKGDLYQIVEPKSEQSIIEKEPQKTNKDPQKKST